MARRNKKEIIIDTISKLDEQIIITEKKLISLKSERADCKAQLKEIEDIELKAKEEEKMNKIISLIKQNNISYEEVEEFLNARKIN